MQTQQTRRTPKRRRQPTSTEVSIIDLLANFGSEAFLFNWAPQARCTQPVLLNNPQNTDFSETETNYTIVSDVGNYNQSDISVTFDGQDLLVSGSRKLNRDTRLLCSNRTTKFSYRFNLENVDINATTAHLNNGTLTVVVPKVQKIVNVVKVTNSEAPSGSEE